MEKCSLLLKRIMLGILLAVLGLTVALILRQGLESLSYPAAMAAGLLWIAGLFLLLRKREGKELPRALRSPWTPVLTAAFCLIVNLPWVLLVRIEPYSDYVVFWNTARALAEGTEVPAPWYIAEFPHLLGTSVILSLPLRLFGSSVMAASGMNVMLGALSCLPVYGITRRMADEKTALLAELLWTFYPCRIMLNSLVLSEPLYTFLVLLFLWWLLYLDTGAMECSGGPVRALLRGAGLGALLALIKIVRPVSPILIVALFIWLFLLRGRGGQWRDWMLLLAALLASYVLCGKLWDRTFEEILGWAPASVPIYNVYVGFNEATRGTWCPEDMDLLFACLEKSGNAAQAQMDLLPYLQERLRAGIDYPALFLDKLLIFLGNDGLGAHAIRFDYDETLIRVLMLSCNVFYYGVILASIAGLVRLFRSRRLSAEQMLPLYVLGLTLAHLLVEVNGRYHYSLSPILIIFAALGLYSGKAGRRKT